MGGEKAIIIEWGRHKIIDVEVQNTMGWKMNIQTTSNAFLKWSGYVHLVRSIESHVRVGKLMFRNVTCEPASRNIYRNFYKEFISKKRKE